MRKNCPNCGERFEGDVCPSCGTAVSKGFKKRTSSSRLAEEAIADKFMTDKQRATAEASLASRKSERNVLIFLIIIVLLAVGFILYRSGVVGGGSYKKPIEQYFKGIATRDFDLYVSTMLESVRDGYISERDELGYDGYGYMDTLYRDLFMQFGEDMKVSLKFGSRRRPDEEFVQSFKSDYLRFYGESINVKTVYAVETTAHFSGELSEADVELDSFVIRQGGKWYIVGCDFAVEEVEE